VFSHSIDPMDAEEWLGIVKRELHTAQCNDREEVLYGPRLLRGVAQSTSPPMPTLKISPRSLETTSAGTTFQKV
jgi:hypothetical protein